MLELILLGTGTSSCLPLIGCLTSNLGCYSCKSTTSNQLSKNVRRNTSAILRIDDKQTILIDCGKSFYNSALSFWSKNQLRQIDAVLLTHPHSDAVGGLDDLRGWTLHGHIQKSIHIYCNQFTFDEIAKSAPYLTDASKATGGGDVPQFQWHIFDQHKPLSILGVDITVLPVHHGQFFSTPPRPYYCLGFLFNSSIAYISDVSYIPESVWQLLATKVQLPSDHSSPSDSAISAISSSSSSSSVSLPLDDLSLNPSANGNGNGHQPKLPILQALIIDCLRIEKHTSHFGLAQSVSAIRRSGAVKSYLVGFGHATSHETWNYALSSLALDPIPASSLPFLYSPDPPHTLIQTPLPEATSLRHGESTTPGVEDPINFKAQALRSCHAWESIDGVPKSSVWVRAACDGMKITIDENGVGTDDEY